MSKVEEDKVIDHVYELRNRKKEKKKKEAPLRGAKQQQEEVMKMNNTMWPMKFLGNCLQGSNTPRERDRSPSSLQKIADKNQLDPFLIWLTAFEFNSVKDFFETQGLFQPVRRTESFQSLIPGSRALELSFSFFFPVPGLRVHFSVLFFSSAGVGPDYSPRFTLHIDGYVQIIYAGQTTGKTVRVRFRAGGNGVIYCWVSIRYVLQLIKSGTL